MDDYFEFNIEQKKQLKDIMDSYDDFLSPYACRSAQSVREFSSKTDNDSIRSPYAVDCDKIINSLQYNRYTDKTQVFSFYKNDDITRRALHVQLVSRIGRTIGHALKLNLDLIEAIALGHDMGHTPFGHRGEAYLNNLYFQNTGRLFNHNVHSVRVFRTILRTNLTLQTLDGILCHNGEKAFKEYHPSGLKTFEEYIAMLENCYKDSQYIKKLHPATLEGCVVRISDMLAYVGKDRQDAKKASFEVKDFKPGKYLDGKNAGIINDVVTNIVKNSLGKPFISMDQEVFLDIKTIYDDNTSKIYNSPKLVEPYDNIVKPMMEKIYNKFTDDILKRDFNSIIFKYYLNHPIQGSCYREDDSRKIIADEHDIVTDFIASMTDDYFLDLFKHIFPEDRLNSEIRYITYFD